MLNRRMALLLKVAVMLVAVSFLIAFGLYAPTLGAEFARGFSQWGYMYWPVLITLWASCIPIAIGLYDAWKICGQISLGNGFCLENARRLKRIAVLAATDGALYAIGLCTLCAKGMMNPGLLLLAFMVLSLVFAVSAAGYALSRLAAHAAALRQDSELTV